MAVADSTDDLDELQATLWNDEPYVSQPDVSSTTEITGMGQLAESNFSQSAGAPTITSTPAPPAPSGNLPPVESPQQFVATSPQVAQTSMGTGGVIGGSPLPTLSAPSPQQPLGSAQILHPTQTPSPLSAGSRYVCLFSISHKYTVMSKPNFLAPHH